MALWLQNLIVAAAVLGCIAYLGTQLAGTFRGRKSKIGSCCAKGCPPAPATGKIIFLPAEELGRRRRMRP